jgi:predicted AAA+ superfamily ATPase
LNDTSLTNDAGISPNTAKSWILILESSYIIYRLQPYHKNFNKRLIKSPKLYFHDTGLACSLLGNRDESQVHFHYMKGALLENLVINEFVKKSFHQGERRFPYFWQDSRGKEIDCLLVEGETITPVEIKSGKTITNSYFENLKYWRQLAGMAEDQGYVVYGGNQSMQTSQGSLTSWKEMDRIQS